MGEGVDTLLVPVLVVRLLLQSLVSLVQFVGMVHAVSADSQRPRAVGDTLHEDACGNAKFFQELVAVVRWVIMFSFRELGDFVIGVVFHPRLGEDVLLVLVEIVGCLHVSDGGELTELFGQYAGSVEEVS